MTRLVAWGARLLAWARAHPAAVVAAVVVVLLLLRGACSAERPAVREEDRREAAAQVEAARHDAAQVEARTLAVRRTVTRTDERPDGSRTVTVEAEERDERAELRSVETDATTKAAAVESSVRVREERRPAPSWRLTLAAGWDVTAPELRPSLYRAELARRVAGPVYVGAWAEARDLGRPRVEAAGLSLSVAW